MGRPRKTLDKKISEISEKEYKAVYKVCKKFRHEYLQAIKKAFNRVKREALKQWYDSYTPKYYHRTLDMYKIPKIQVDDDNGINISFDSDNMTKWHRVSHEYIYENSYIKGFHGGADDFKGTPKPFYEQKHPNPGVPYWRWPYKITLPETGETVIAPWPPKDGDPTSDDFPYRYRYWGKAAKQTTSPYSLTIKYFKLELRILSKKYSDDLKERLNKTIQPFNDQMQQLYDLYGGDTK